MATPGQHSEAIVSSGNSRVYYKAIEVEKERGPAVPPPPPAPPRPPPRPRPPKPLPIRRPSLNITTSLYRNVVGIVFVIIFSVRFINSVLNRTPVMSTRAVTFLELVIEVLAVLLLTLLVASAFCLIAVLWLDAVPVDIVEAAVDLVCFFFLATILSNGSLISSSMNRSS
uniref:Uncharacterized protein n=1 Tax=Glossina brevipalpis TaxID=37001 RepID=A0A1A9X295_9MUSC